MDFDNTKSRFEDLKVWKTGRELRVEISAILKFFPIVWILDHLSIAYEEKYLDQQKEVDLRDKTLKVITQLTQLT